MARTELAKKDPRDIDIGGLRLTAVGLGGTLTRPPTIDEFKAAMAFIGRAAGASNWWVGDLSNHADEWGDEYVQLLDELGIEYETVRKYAWVAKQVEIVRRRTNVSWTHHEVVSALTPTEQTKWLKRAQPKEGEVTPKLSVRELKNKIANRKAEDPPAPPAGTYRSIVIDPPWDMGKIERTEKRPKQGHTLAYPTMSIEEITSLPLEKLGAEDGCHIYLWVTQKYLPDGIKLLEAWGYRYQCTMTWVKPTGMTPFSWMYNTEHVLFGTKGSLRLAQKGLKLSFDAAVKKGTHSEKPDVFYERVLSASPEPRLEMFARKDREGFVPWGDEVDSVEA